MTLFSINLKDLAVNISLSALSKLRYILRITRKGSFKIPNNYKLVFSDMFGDIGLRNWQDASL
jgi:hypothetical protein